MSLYETKEKVDALKTIEECYEYATINARITRNMAFRLVNRVAVIACDDTYSVDRLYYTGYYAGMFDAYGLLECRLFVSKIIELARNEKPKE